MYCPMKENGFVPNITVRGVLKGEWTRSQVPFIDSEYCLFCVQYVRTEHLKTTAVILNLIVCFETVWSFLALVWNKLDMVTRNVKPSFTVLSFTDSQLLTQNIRAKIAAAKFWHLPVWLGSFFLLLGAGCRARTFWGRAELPGWKDWSWSPRCPG